MSAGIGFMLAGLEYLDKIMYAAYRTAMKIRLIQSMSNSMSIVHAVAMNERLHIDFLQCI